MNHIITVAKAYISQKIGWRSRSIMNSSDGTKRFAGKRIMDCRQTQEQIRALIASGEPCCIARLGGNELFSMSCFEFGIDIKKEKAIDQLYTCAGFFPNDIAYGDRYNTCMKEACGQMDLLGISVARFEEYYIQKYAPKHVKLTRIHDLEPWKQPDHPWSDILEGKKVLVIHPLADTILEQYRKREQLFGNTKILPTFELKTLRAVQTIAGEKDERFANWFEALEWMYQEAMKIDFDIAIIGCGAYGFPLAAKLKQAGKQAVHLGGVTQVMFGIKGRRWVENANCAYIQAFFNDAWVYPSDADKPKNAKEVEDACYW